MSIRRADDSGRGTVWIVEDSPLEAEVARRALAPSFEVLVFPEGEAMLEHLATNDLPDVLLLDWQLPGLSGVEVCEFIRSRANHVALPILVMTSPQLKKGTVVEGLTAGANDYVPKPYEAAELVARVKSLALVKQLHRRALEFEKQLLGIVSHDLRSPLNVITLSTQTIRQAVVATPATQKSLRRIEDAAFRADRMIHDLLDFTQARLGGRIPVSPRPANLHELASRAVEEVALAHPDRPVALETDGDGDGLLDPDRFTQVITNLLTNAFRYGAPGTQVTVKTAGDESELWLSVKNLGAPIDGRLSSRLFEPFQRGEGTSTSERSVGLGLYIVKKVVEGHDGSITVSSSEAAGTTFTVRIPRRATRVEVRENIA